MKYRQTGHGFEDYYVNQVGHGLSVYAGSPMQRGHGLGNVLKGLFRIATPLLKSAGKLALKHSKPLLKEVGKQALKRGVDAIATEMNKPKRHRAVRASAQIIRAAAQPRTRNRRKVTKDIFSQ